MSLLSVLCLNLRCVSRDASQIRCISLSILLYCSSSTRLMHFSQGDGEVSFCGGIEIMSRFLELKCSAIKDGKQLLLWDVGPSPLSVNPIFEIGPLEPRYCKLRSQQGVVRCFWKSHATSSFSHVRSCCRPYFCAASRMGACFRRHLSRREKCPALDYDLDANVLFWIASSIWLSLDTQRSKSTYSCRVSHPTF